MPSDKLTRLYAKSEELVTEARSKLDSITDEMPRDQAEAIEREADDLLNQNDEIRSQITREQRLADEENRRLADEEANRREVPTMGNPANANDPNAERRDDNLTREERRNRDQLLVRYMNGYKPTDEESILMHRKAPEERAWHMYIQHGLMALPDEIRRQLVTPRDGETRDFPADAGLTGGQVVGTDAAGGYLAPLHFMAEMVKSLKDYAGFWDTNLTRMIQTAEGREIEFTSFDDTGNMGAAVAEGGHAGFTKGEWGQIMVGANKYTTKAFPVSRELIQDNVFDIESEIRAMANERFGRVLELHTSNSAKKSGQITGFIQQVTGTGLLQNTGKASEVNWEALIDLIHKIDRGYRMNDAFVFHDSTLAQLRKQKDSNGNPIWQQSTRDGEPDRIVGKPYVLNAHFDAAGTVKDKIPVAYGNFKKFVTRMVRDLSVRRLDEIAALSDQVVFVGFGRFDAKVLDIKAFATYKTTAG